MPIEIKIETKQRTEFIDITARIREILLRQAGVQGGMAHIFIPHTTAGITVNENADPDVEFDMLNSLEKLIPRQANYRHYEGNSAAHLKASLMGSSVTIPLKDGNLALGRWQGVYFCEFDGPRLRSFLVTILNRL